MRRNRRVDNARAFDRVALFDRRPLFRRIAILGVGRATRFHLFLQASLDRLDYRGRGARMRKHGGMHSRALAHFLLRNESSHLRTRKHALRPARRVLGGARAGPSPSLALAEDQHRGASVIARRRQHGRPLDHSRPRQSGYLSTDDGLGGRSAMKRAGLLAKSMRRPSPPAGAMTSPRWSITCATKNAPFWLGPKAAPSAIIFK